MKAETNGTKTFTCHSRKHFTIYIKPLKAVSLANDNIQKFRTTDLGAVIYQNKYLYNKHTFTLGKGVWGVTLVCKTIT